MDNFNVANFVTLGLGFLFILIGGLLIFIYSITDTKKENVILKKELDLKNRLLNDSLVREKQLRNFLDGYTFINEEGDED